MNQPHTQARDDCAPLTVTEDDIADYLQANPDFFARHSTLLANVKLISPHSGRAVSLADRQMEMLREKFKALELKHSNLLRVGKDNVTLAGKLHQWMLNLLDDKSSGSGKDQHISQSLQDLFDVPQVGILRSETAVQSALQLSGPRCGLVVDEFFGNINAMGALEQPELVHSVAVIPLPSVGLLVLASPDPNRFTSEMGTEFLTRLGELAHAALR